MPIFDDISEYLSPSLELPWAGKVYKIDSPPAQVGLRLQAVWAIRRATAAGQEPAARDAALAGADEIRLEQDSLGPVWDELIADGAPMAVLEQMGVTAYFWIVAGESAARAHWASLRGEVSSPTPKRKSRRPGAATSTRKRASQTSTTSPTTNGDSSPQ